MMVPKLDRTRNELRESDRLIENGVTKSKEVWMRFHSRCKKGQRMRPWENGDFAKITDLEVHNPKNRAKWEHHSWPCSQSSLFSG